jgi:hypothetical protein
MQITSISQERNPIARKIMKQFGIHATIWGIFIISVIIVSVSVWLLFVYYDTTTNKTLFIIIGLLVSISQFAVAHTNKTKRLNIFTKLLLKAYKI